MTSTLATSPRLAPPHNHVAEQTVLGAMLVDADATRRVRAVGLATEDFYHPGHQALFVAITAIADAGGVVDELTVRDALTEAGVLERVGGWAYVVSLTDALGAVETADAAADIVRREAERRRVALACYEAAEAAVAPGAVARDVAAAAIARLLPTAAPATGTTGFRPLSTLVWAAGEAMEARMRGEDRALVTSGIPEFDDAAGGIERGDLVTLVLVSGHGKTALQLAMAASVAEQGIGVGFVSAEMTGQQLAWRLMAARAGVPFWQIKRGRVAPEQMPRLAAAMTTLAAFPIHVDETAAPRLDGLAARVRGLVARVPTIGVVFVDYAQLIQASTGSDDEGRPRQIDLIATALKALAKEVGVAIIQSAQPDAARIERASGRKMPTLADIAWGQAIRNASDIVMTGFRPGKYDPSADDTRIECAVPKSRAAGDTEFTLGWAGETMTVSSPRLVEHRWQAEQAARAARIRGEDDAGWSL